MMGLAALFLGGIGVASAIHVYVKEKIVTVAVLRCLGARQRTIFGAYLLQAAVVAFVLAAMLTPPDGMSQFLVAVPLLVLYLVGVAVAAIAVVGVAERPVGSGSPQRRPYGHRNGG